MIRDITLGLTSLEGEPILRGVDFGDSTVLELGPFGGEELARSKARLAGFLAQH
jgi:hypothetical protein